MQHCAYDEGCLEFQGHREVCQITDEQNCGSLFQGEYAAGACPAETYATQETTNTSCGITVWYYK